MSKYRVIIGCSNPIGLGLIDDIIAVAKLGGELESGINPRMTFPFHVQMIVESEVAPTPSPHVRVFNLETKEEVKVVPVSVKKEAATFSLTEETTNKPTKEQLDAIEWSELQAMAKAAGVTGRDRAKVTKAYLEKFV